MLSIYWRYLCCESRVPIDDVEPSRFGTAMCDSDDFDRFGEWAHISTWKDFDGCPNCDAPVPSVYGREFVIEP